MKIVERNKMETHTMALVNMYEDGSQEWKCPICKRRFIITYPPNYKRTIIEEGDSEVAHCGGTNGLVMGETTVEDCSDFGENDMGAELGDSGIDVFTNYLNGLIK